MMMMMMMFLCDFVHHSLRELRETVVVVTKMRVQEFTQQLLQFVLRDGAVLVAVNVREEIPQLLDCLRRSVRERRRI